MTTDYEQVLHAHLRPAADDSLDTDLEALVERTTRLGTRRRNRHRVIAVTGAAASAVAVLVAVATVPRPWAPPAARISPATSASASEPWTDLTSQTWPVALSAPPATGAVTATADPAVVGADPRLLHLSLAAPPGRYVGATWESGPGYESVQLTDDTQLAQSAANSSGVADATVTISPRQATLRPALPATAEPHGTVAVGTSTATEYRAGDGEFYLRWQVGKGTWAQVFGLTDEAKLRAVAAAVRLDTVTRCVAPFRLGYVPTGLTPQTCQLSLNIPSRYGNGPDYITTATYQFADGHGSTKLMVLLDPPTEGSCTPDTTLVGGRTATWSGFQGVAPSVAGALSLCQPVNGYPLRVVTFAPYGHDDAVAVANQLSVPAGATGPATWPAQPVG